jgi:lysophospholipase L1-like esterase
MKYVLIALSVLVVGYVGFEFFRIARLAFTSVKLTEEAMPFIRTGGTRSMLVLGDSTAVGVGSAAQETVAGRLAQLLDSSAENYAKSGALTADLSGQISSATREHYDIVLVHIGANDIIRFHSVGETASELDEALVVLREKSDHVVLLTAGKVGEAPFFPQLFSWLWTRQAARLRTVFMTTAEKRGVAYVDLFSAPDPFSEDPVRYYAPDGLHLTGAGYGFWFEEVRKEIESRWPEFTVHGQ